MFEKKYFEIRNGKVPVVLSCAHGGYKKSKRIPDKLNGPAIADQNTYFLSKMIINGLIRNDVQIYYILNKIHRSKVDLNRPALSISAINQNSIEALNIHNLFHDCLDRFTQECLSKYKRCLLIDLHGFTKPSNEYPDVIFGHVFGKTLTEIQDSSHEDCNRFWGCAQLQDEICKNFTLDDGLGINNFNLSYSGGYITQRFYNQPKINAIQIEIAKYIRTDNILIKKIVQALISAILSSLHD